MQILAFASQIGSSGKTTLAGHIAVLAERMGAGPVALLDADPQGSLADWWNERKAETPVFVHTTIAWLEDDIERLRGFGIELLVIDTLTARSFMTPDEITVAVIAPPEIAPPVAQNIIEAPEPTPEPTQLAALNVAPAIKAVAAKEPNSLPPTPPAKAVKAPVQIRPSVAVKPVYRVQLHALGSKAVARREWRKIKNSHKDLFGRKKMTLLRGKNKSSRIRFVRLQAGPFTGFRDARNLCSRAKKCRIACVVVRQ